MNAPRSWAGRWRAPPRARCAAPRPPHRTYPRGCRNRFSSEPRRATCLLCFFQAEDGIRDGRVTAVQTCALPIFEGGDDLGVLGQIAVDAARAACGRLAL